MKKLLLLVLVLTTKVCYPQQALPKSEDHTKKINSQMRKVKAGFMVSGFAFMGGAALNLIASGKNEPSIGDYTDLSLFQRDYDAYVKKQKGLQRQSNFLFLAGGAIMLISGINISTVLIKNNSQNISLIANPASVGVEYKF